MVRNAFAHDFGGGERVPVNIATELRKNGLHPIIVSRSPKLLAFAQEKGLDSIRGWWWSKQDWSGVNNVLTPFYIFWQLLLTLWYLQLIVRTSATVVHLQSKDDFIAGTIAAKLLRRRVIWSDYADLKYVYQNNTVWYKNPIGKVVWYLSRYASSIILTSQSDKNFIETSLGHALPERYKIVHYGVNSEEIPIIKRPTSDKEAVIFAATSRLVIAKGIGELIEAFNTISVSRDNIRLWLFGEGPDAEQFKAVAATNKHIVFRGFPDDTLSRVADVDVFVHPSYLEGFSISLVEAAKLGLPIIACDVGGNPELVVDHENGLLVSAQDAVALADAMAFLADNEKAREAYGKKAREAYESRLVFENIIKDTIIPLYEK